MDTLDHELDDMAEKINARRDAVPASKKINWKKVHNFLCAPALWGTLVCTLFLVGGVAGVMHQEKNFRKSEMQLRQIQNYNNKHWPNVLVLIHERDAKRAAEIIAEVDKPYKLLDTTPFKEYQNRSYLITIELEEILKNKGVRYQRQEFDKEGPLLSDAFTNSGGHIHVFVEITPYINW